VDSITCFTQWEGFYLPRFLNDSAMPKDFSNQPGLPIGLRNNNPGNLRPGDNWQGMTGTNGGFIVFEDCSWGLRALAIDLGSKINNGYDTIALIIDRYAPEADNNDTAAYIANVARTSGFGANQILSDDGATLSKLMRGIVNVELGSQFAQMITSADINEGISKAGVQIPVGEIGFSFATGLFLVALYLLATSQKMPKIPRS
jgi:hypothetical protein